MKIIKNCLTALTLIISTIFRLYAQTTGASFLQNDPSPRSFAMGGSGVVASKGSQAIGANPANMGLMSRRFELFTSYQQLSGGMQYGQLAAAMALSSSFLPIDSVGLSVTRQQIGGINGTDSQNNPTGNSLGAGEMAIGLSGAGHIGSLRYGLTGKAIQEQIGGYNSNTAIAADMGLSYGLRGFYGLSLGASVDNLGRGVKFLDQTDPLPTSANLGASLLVGPAVGVVTVSRLVNDQKTNMGLGMAYSIGPVELRAGYMAQKGGGTNLALQDARGMTRMMNGISGGMGINMGTARLDYAVSEGAADLGPNQRVALTLQFGRDSNSLNEAVPMPHKQNTWIIQQSQSQESQDQLDWHMINVEGK